MLHTLASRVRLLYKTNNILGEGPLWHPLEQVLYWVDIEDKRIHRLELDTQQHQSFAMPTRPGAVAAHASGGVVVALEHGLAHFAPATGSLTLGAQPLAGRSDVRFNDGKCDRQGRFWVGSLDLAELEPLGELICFASFEQGVTQDSGFTVSNGLGWSPDNRTMYFTDSPRRTIFQYDFDSDTGAINRRRMFVQLSAQDGYPDGLCVDSEGYVWVCHWDGWKITRFAPNGSIDKVIALPVARPTCCCFGGKDLDQLFVTSARRDLTAAELAKTPDAGSVFVIETGCVGLAEKPASFVIPTSSSESFLS